jgi:group I intron endonuclease
MGCVYRFFCKSSGKSYIGQYKKNTPDGEWRRYCNDAKKVENPTRHLIRAIKKYGENDFEISILCLCDSQYELDKKEDEYITEYNSMCDGNGYNMVRGGRGRAPNFHHKEEHKINMSNKMKGRIISEETKAKISNARKGSKCNWSKETRERVAEATRRKATGVVMTDEQKAKISMSLKGRPGVTKGQKRTEEQKRRIGDASKGRIFSEESKKKMSNERKARFQTTANSQCKINAEDIHYIRNNPDNLTKTQLSQKYNCKSVTTITNIINRKSYKHIPENIGDNTIQHVE